MSIISDYTITALRSLLQDSQPPEMPQGVSVKELYDFSRSHSLEAMVYRAVCQLDADLSAPDLVRWTQWVNRLLAQSIVQLEERDRIIAALTGAGIDVLPLKGCYLKEAYPDINDRKMSDLDMLVHPEDAPAVEKLLLQLDYRKEDVTFNHTTYVKPPYTALELHIQLLPDTDPNAAHYRDVWARAVPSEDTPHLYRLRPEEEYVYYLVHLNTHLREGGSGIRSILDHYFYLRMLGTMDEAYIRQQLQAMELDTLAGQVAQLSRCWFETGEAVPQSLSPLAQALRTSGTYGSVEARAQMRMDRLREKYGNGPLLFFAYCLPRFFRPMSEMRRSYPILNRLPLLLPVFWVVRLAGKMFSGKKSFWPHLLAVLRGGKKHG